MGRHVFYASALAALCVSGLMADTAYAHGTQWSVTVGNQPRGVVVPQSHYRYGAPPSVYAPPPQILPPPVVVAPPPVIYVQPPPYPVYVNPPQHRHWHDRRGGYDRHDRYDQGRRDWNDGRQQQWGYGQGYNQGQGAGYGYGYYGR